MNKDLDKYKEALIEIRNMCRDHTLNTDVKIMEIYHIASSVLDGRSKVLNDIRTGRI